MTCWCFPKEVGRYDPTKGYYVGGTVLAELFRAARARAIEDISQIPIAHLAYRLRSLQRLSEAAERTGNLKLAARLIEQAAKEVGGCYVKSRPALASELPAPLSASPAAPEVEPAATDPDPANERDAAQPRPTEAPPSAAANATEWQSHAQSVGNPEPEAPRAPDAEWDAQAALRDRVAGATG